jgi:hypothetical protein
MPEKDTMAKTGFLKSLLPRKIGYDNVESARFLRSCRIFPLQMHGNMHGNHPRESSLMQVELL